MLPHLDTFVEAAERGGFSSAARSLEVSQATVSQRIGLLEAELGKLLFERSAGRAELTEAGKALHEMARRILRLHDEARQAVTGQAVPAGGVLTIAASSVPGEHLLPGLLADYRSRYPGVRIRASVSDTRAVLEDVRRGRADLGLVGGKDNQPGVGYSRLARDEIVLLVPAGHPWARRKKVKSSDLRGQPLVLREPGSGSRQCLEEALAQAGEPLSEMTVVMELGSNEAVKEAVLRGAGIAALSRQAASREIEAGHLAALEIAGASLGRDLYLARSTGRPLSEAARLFEEMATALGQGA
jgi:DNA-binding transcriptional LysR family regulator